MPGADEARIVVDFDDRQLYVSGFVQNGDLIQTVDVDRPARPTTATQMVRGGDGWSLGRVLGRTRRERTQLETTRSSRSAFHRASAYSSSTSECTVMPPPVPSR